MDYMERWDAISKYDKAMDSRGWISEIPYIKFPNDLEVQIIPPFTGAIVRFRVKHKDGDKSLSVYLDGYDILGCCGKPYWEIYPYENDVFRCGMHDIDELVEKIQEELEQ